MAAPIQRFGEKVIPTIWKERTIKRDFDIVLGKMLQSEQQNDDETEEPYLRTANVQWDGIDISDVKTMWFSPVEKDKLLLQQGDLVVNEGGDVGRCAIWNNELPACYFQNAINRARPIRKCDTTFLHYWLYNMKHAGFIDALVSKTTIAHLTAEKLEALPFPDTPWKEQKLIAAYLDKSCTTIDAAVQAKRSQIETLDELRKAILTRAITQGVKEGVNLESTGNVWMEKIPHGWSLTALKRVSEIQTGLTLGKTYEGELVELPYLRVANVQDGHLDLSDVTLIEVPPNVALRVQLRAGDVLMTEGGDLDKLGRGYLWNGEIHDCLHQNHIFAVRCFQHKLLPLFLTHLTASKHGRNYFEATGKRTTNLASTSSKKVGLFPIPLPPISEQKEICDYIEQKNSEIRELINKIEKQIDVLLGYRKSLIHECVTGQRRVTD